MRIGRQIILLLLCLLPPITAQTGRQPASGFATLAAEANAARDTNRFDEAIVLYGKALAIRPTWTEGWWSLGTLEYDQNAYRDAASAFQKAIALDPKAGTARIMLGLCEFELGQDESALTHIQEGKRIGAADSRELRNVALYHEGVLLQRLGKFQEAQETLDSLCLGGVETGEVERTLGMVALRIRDKNAPAQGAAAEIVNRVGHAECLAGEKKFDEARTTYSAVTRDHPEYPNIHYAFGRFLLDARDTASGIAELEREIKNHPGDTLARLQIAAAKYKVDSAAGLPYAEAAVKLDPNPPFGHYLLGLLLLDTDDYQRAIPELEIAQRGLSHEPGVYSALGAAYSRAGRDQDAARARAAFLRWKKEAPTASAPQP